MTDIDIERTALRSRMVGGIRADHEGVELKLAGWVHRRRDLGGLTFLQVRDRSGVVQVVLRPEDHAEAAKTLDPVRLEWVSGIVRSISKRRVGVVDGVQGYRPDEVAFPPFPYPSVGVFQVRSSSLRD